MAFIPVPNCAELEFLCTYAGQKVENTLGFSLGVPANEEALTTLATTMKSWWVGAFGPNLVAAVSLNTIKVRALDAFDSPALEFGTGLPVVGTGAGSGAPNNVAACISFSTGAAGRSRRGRNYVFGMPTSVITLSTFDAGWMTAIAGAYNDIQSLVEPDGWTWSVLSRYSGVNPTTHKPIPRTAGIHTAILNAVFHDNTADSQRRRLPGRGT